MLAAGTTLGPYRILAPIGAGGMGEVYRARDGRLARDVAVKVLPPQFAADAERLRRFTREAHAAGVLNHPNVCTLFDVGTHEGAPYVVMELLEGESLRARLRDGALPWRRAAEFAAQAAEGLAAAHAKGIVHRDLKPENLFVTKDGRVKVLDFGLAKLTRPEGAEGVPGESAPTISVGPTETGAILGTVGYMSPEQVRGQAVDHRSDLFALGTILHEMLTGEQTFTGASPVETQNAILTAEPAPLSAPGREVPPALELIVSRCLEKSPEERFQSARDLAFDLKSMSGVSGSVVPPDDDRKPATHRRRTIVALTGAALLILAGLAGAFLGRRGAVPSGLPRYSPLTHQRGAVETARFAADGDVVVYRAKWGSAPSQLYSIRRGQIEERAVGYPGSVKAIVGVEMAVVSRGVLARLPVDGGTPRELVEDVRDADWSRDGRAFAVVRQRGDSLRLEYPLGRVLFSSPVTAPLEGVRLSPRGDLVALIERPPFGNTTRAGDVVLIDTTGARRVLSRGWRDVLGLAWTPDGRELWLTGTRGPEARQVWSVDMRGRERLRLPSPEDLMLHDIAADGTVLLARQQARGEVRGRLSGDSTERDLSWLDGTTLPLLSPDGRELVFGEDRLGGGPAAATFLRRAGPANPVHLSSGRPMDVSPDWKWALVGVGSPGAIELRVVPLASGQVTAPPRGALERIAGAWWHPDGRRIILLGRAKSGAKRLFLQSLPDGVPQAFGPAEVALEEAPLVVSPPGTEVAVRLALGRPYVLLPIAGGEARAIAGMEAAEVPLRFGSDRRTLFVATWDRGALVVSRIALANGRRERWLELRGQGEMASPPTSCSITPDGHAYAFGYRTVESQLLLVDGLMSPRPGRRAKSP